MVYSKNDSGQSYDALPQYDGPGILPTYEVSNSVVEHSPLPEQSPNDRTSNSEPSSTVSFDCENYTPYKLELGKTGLYPEFLFYFKKSFAAESAENEAYCFQVIDESTSYFNEEKRENEITMAKIENDFDQKFRQCLDPDVLKEFSSWRFTRECVETTLKNKLAETADVISYPMRLRELTKGTHNFKTEPLVNFLLAFGHSEEYIWNVVIYSLFERISKDKRETSNAVAQKWQKESGPLVLRVQSFADETKLGGLCACCGFVLLSFMIWFVFFSGVFKW